MKKIQKRKGQSSLEVIMITAIAFPFAFIMLTYFSKALIAFYGFISVLTNWAVL
jgi:hypothetical protein